MPSDNESNSVSAVALHLIVSILGRNTVVFRCCSMLCVPLHASNVRSQPRRTRPNPTLSHPRIPHEHRTIVPPPGTIIHRRSEHLYKPRHRIVINIIAAHYVFAINGMIFCGTNGEGRRRRSIRSAPAPTIERCRSAQLLDLRAPPLSLEGRGFFGFGSGVLSLSVNRSL